MIQFQVLGRRISRAVYDPVGRIVYVIYRSGRERTYWAISSERALMILAVVKTKFAIMLSSPWWQIP
jgi:hypothetical protein